jgi:hypothetical protein
MKNTLIIIFFLFFCNQLIAQELPLSQNQWFENGQKYLIKGQLEIAVGQFSMANMIGENSNVKILARQKIDSLLPLIRKKNIREWKGNWKIKELNYNPYPGKFSDYIRFTDDKIIFYQKKPDGKEIILRSEPFKFLQYDSIKYDANIRKVEFKNSEIWSFWVGTKNSQKRLYPKLERDSLGISIMLLDERGFTTDRKLRKREMEKEIYTFYVIAK